LKVWYDKWVLTIGDRLLEKIDQGLSQSRYGIVVLSPNFLKKDWPKNELEGLMQREIAGKKVILPVWHNVKRKDIMKYSLILASKLAGTTEKGIVKLAGELILAMTDNHVFLRESKNKVKVAGNGSKIVSFDITSPLLWKVSDERYTAIGTEDTFAWSEEIIEGDVIISANIESNHENGEGVIIVYGDGVNWSPGCLIFNITSNNQSIRAHTVYEGVKFLRDGRKHLEFINHVFAVKIEILGDKTTVYVDGEKILSTFLPKYIKRKGRVGLFKYWERPDVTFSNIVIECKREVFQ
jgi:hypothetical protein